MAKEVLIVGLGNPGKEYAKTRHNVGFMCLDFYCEKNNLFFSEKFNGLIASQKVNGNNFHFLKPLTMMNASGLSVVQAAKFYKIQPENIIVIHDDMDIDVGTIKYRIKGSSGGHNGIKSIISSLSSENFKRVKVGIGKPDIDELVIDYVLGKFSKKERVFIDEAICDVNRFLELFVSSVDEDAFDKVVSKIANGNK